MELCVVSAVLVAALALAIWALKSIVNPPRRPARRTTWGSRSGGYESPLGLVDDPEDEWIEVAIMDDLLDDQW